MQYNYAMEKSLTFITGNHAKVQQVKRYLKIPFTHRSLDLPEIQSLDLREIVGYKVRAAFEIVKRPVFVEDVSLVFHAIGKLPGPLIKWFLQELNNDGLCKMLDQSDTRRATAMVNYAYFDGDELKIFEGIMEGSISPEPRGIKSFGWDPIFIPVGFVKTWSEMNEDERARVSMRSIALEKFKKWYLG